MGAVANMIVLKAKLVERRPLDVARDNWREIMRAAYRAVGLYWIEHFLPLHFKDGAAERYRYKFRSAAYRKRKDIAYREGKPFQKYGDRVIAGSSRPLVLTGTMMRDVLETNTVRGFPTRCTVRMFGPQYMTTRFFRKNQPDKPKEITTVRPDEATVLSRVLRDAVQAGIEEYRRRRSKVTE